ncbi:S-layer homology domain-containing protein [uncultured Oscillibacter sp.]|uniref:S-layer homology domain-containing protein n=1 Tax=uncultured Oscillibacter sp. TaxID=876091 RepID=UPI002613E3F8|nr:S-layer homology domain-containing protein [uncultured Oscillibacter sp.]
MSIKFPNLKRFFSLFLAAVMMVSLLAVNAHAANTNKITDYGDAYGHWAYEALTWAVDNGVLVGTSGDKLNPDGYLTRAQMAAMIDRLFGTYKSADISRYTDVPRGIWHHDYIAQAVHMGTFAGYSSSRMGPDENITREQAMVVLARTVCLPAASQSELARFSDRGQVGAWAADSVAAMAERGYVNGYRDGLLSPKGKITRAEMAQIMCNIFQSVHDSGEIAGTYRDAVLVRGAVNIKDAVFESDLILANGLGEKALGLNNITVKGRLVVWGGSAVNISGKSTVASVVTPRNDGPVQVVFDAAAAELSEKDCAIVYPSGMDKGNKVLFTDKADKPTIAFDLPAYRYVGDSITVKTTLTGVDAVTWELTRDGKSVAIPEGFTKDGGICYFMEAGRYVLRGTVENSGGKAFCEKTVEVLPVGDIAFSLPEYGYTDRAEDVKLLLKNDLDGSVVWTLTKDGANQPLASFTKDGGTLALTETGKYILTATLTDAAGKQYTASQSITILPVIVPTVAASVDKVHEDDTVEIGLTVEGGKPDSVRWTLTCDGKEAAVSLSNQGGTLTFETAGDYVLTAIAKDTQGREFSSEPVAITVIPNLPLSLTANTDKLHEDEAAAISLTVEHGAPSTVAWALTRDGEGVPVSLEDNGGTLTFDGAGAYVLTATITDELGREYTATLPLEVWPVIVLTLDAPETAHIDQTAAVSLSGTDLDVVWEVASEDGAAIDNALTNSGGEITFPAAGNYTVSASVTDYLGRTFIASAAISVWDTMGLSFKLPEFSHPDETVKVKMTSENVGDSKIAWSLSVDGQSVSLSAGINGTLDNAGGNVKFIQTGTNILTASVTDGLGRAFTYEQTIKVYPVLSLGLSADAAAHTDEPISISLNKDTGLPVAWSVTPSNDPSTPTAYSGELSENGGTIQITSAGAYDISASVTDPTGRVFAAPAVTVMVYPVAGLDFTLPAAAWTDSSTPVDLLTSDLQGQDVTWTLTKDGAAVSLTDNMLGDLGNLGGKARFPAVGTYTLTASAVDALGRSYSCEQTIRIYPVVGLTISLSDMSHTDTAEDVRLTTENLGSNEVVWTVLRDGKEIMPPFDLTAKGGHGFFPEAGRYTFTASVTDELGRVTTASDSIQIYPVGVSGFYLPKMFHTDSLVTLVTGFEELGENPLRWSLTRNGENVPVSDYVTGELTADGGKIQFKQAGEYKLKASFKDAGGRSYSYEQSFTVYPIPVIAWTMPSYAHTDSTFTVAVESKNVIADASVQWHIDDTYGLRQNWGTYVAGTLGAFPGDIRIKHAGVFTLTCEITDLTGRVFSFDGPSIEVLADQELQVDIIEKQVYTGETVQVRTLGNNIELPVEWSLEKDGKPADISTYVTGDLNNLGGAIQFTQGGEFRLIGTLRDGLGRTFTASDTITVLPVGSLQFSMADMEYVGNRVPVVMDKLFNPDGATITWSAQKDGAACIIDLSTLDNGGGTVIFPEPGEYTLTATLRDLGGKTATASQSITIIFKAALTVTAPDSIHIGTKFPVGISGAGSLDVSWGVKLGGRPVTLDSNTGFLSNDGGNLALYAEGTYTITATVRDDAGNLTSGFVHIIVTNTAPVIERFTANATRNMKDGRFYADLNAVASDPDGDAVHLEWSSEYQQDGYYEVGTHTIRVRAVDEWGAVSAWESRTIEFINNAPVITSFTASVTRQTSGNTFRANVSATASDPDGDTVRLEWGGDYNSSGWYSRNGSHTIRVRAVDSYGAASPWQEKTIEFVNQAPSKPVISRNPANGVVRPSQAVTITARSTDPEGDAITYEWEGRDKETTTYGYGKHLVKCRAVDAFGAASPWSAIMFFVADNAGGGMTLNSANSFIEETGVSFQDDGETIYGYITEYTFDVPPVSGHSGSDYGKIEAYNIRTRRWDQIAYKETINGVTLSGKLPTGTYTQMRFYYYTNHDCMYNKSNITYSIVFDF